MPTCFRCGAPLHKGFCRKCGYLPTGGARAAPARHRDTLSRDYDDNERWDRPIDGRPHELKLGEDD